MIFFATKFLITSSNEIEFAVSDSIDKIAKPFNLLSDILEGKYDISFKHENERFEEQLLTSIDLQIHKTISILGKISIRFRSLIQLHILLILYTCFLSSIDPQL